MRVIALRARDLGTPDLGTPDLGTVSSERVSELKSVLTVMRSAITLFCHSPN
ncbi:hypothetical protein PL11201_680030 [Planktothrix sp. PCC 11201]|nr:hypothetical protein PL11201_680030 [Planktothrix sp. PCC 11201]